MRALTERARAAGAVRARVVAEDVAAGIEAPGISVTIEGSDVVLSGRGLRRRLITDARLRAIGLMWRSGR